MSDANSAKMLAGGGRLKTNFVRRINKLEISARKMILCKTISVIKILRRSTKNQYLYTEPQLIYRLGRLPSFHFNSLGINHNAKRFATRRYGREDEEVMGLKFCNEAIIALQPIWPKAEAEHGFDFSPLQVSGNA